MFNFDDKNSNENVSNEIPEEIIDNGNAEKRVTKITFGAGTEIAKKAANMQEDEV